MKKLWTERRMKAKYIDTKRIIKNRKGNPAITLMDALLLYDKTLERKN